MGCGRFHEWNHVKLRVVGRTVGGAVVVWDFTVDKCRSIEIASGMSLIRVAAENKNRPPQPTIKFRRFLPINFLPLPAPS